MIDASALSQVHVRLELVSYLSELQARDPRLIWQADRQRGLASGIDEVFHFFFDDHAFDDSDVGLSLYNANEVELVSAVKRALDSILKDVGDAGDDTFVSHPLWHQVRQSAVTALSQMQSCSHNS